MTTPLTNQGSPNWDNRTLFHGDNLKFLRAMNSDSVHLIATDPPFKKGRDFHATPESLASGASFQDRWSWDRDVHTEWLDQIRDDYPALWEVIDAANAIYMRKTKKNLRKPREEVGSDMGAFLCFMAVRLLEMRRVLREDGSIYLHCDWSAGHYLKAIMDSIFGQKNLINEVVWHYSNASRGKRRMARSHEIIFWYSKSKGAYRFNRDDVLVDFQSDMTEWRYTKGGQAGKPMPKGKTPDDVISIPALNAMSKERYGYPTQKPLQLYGHLILAASCEGDIVLDPFAGCATTLVAAERLAREWVGIDLWGKTKDAVLSRLEREGLLGKFTRAEMVFTKTPPTRTDGGHATVPYLRPRESIEEPRDQFRSNAERKRYLLEQHGPKCQGCDRTFDDPRYLELDHKTPRADGGNNYISNRVLLCTPCNRTKSHTLTLSGLRRLNKKNGWMANQQSSLANLK